MYCIEFYFYFFTYFHETHYCCTTVCILFYVICLLVAHAIFCMVSYFMVILSAAHLARVHRGKCTSQKLSSQSLTSWACVHMALTYTLQPLHPAIKYSTRLSNNVCLYIRAKVSTIVSWRTVSVKYSQATLVQCPGQKTAIDLCPTSRDLHSPPYCVWSSC